MTARTRPSARTILLVIVGLLLGSGVVAAPASATTCPSVSSGVVSPAPSPGVDWQGCDLTGADLTSANLTGANLRSTNLTGANLTGANLTSADLTGATIANTQQGSFRYNAVGAQLTVVGYAGAGGAEVLFSAPLPGYLTRVIGDFAFASNTSITTLVIPSTLTEIQANAFLDSRITAIGTSNPPIGVTLPEGLHTIGTNAFVQYSADPTTTTDYSLSGPLTLPSTLTSLGTGAFYRAGITGSVTIPAGVTQIGAQTFEMTKITGVVLHDDITSIGDTAFRGTQLTALDLPESLTSLGAGAFRDIGNPDWTFIYPWLRITPTLTGPLVVPPGITAVPSNAFHGSKFTAISFAGSTTSIGPYAFWSSTDPGFICPFPSELTSLTLPSSLVTIGESAFEGVDQLSGVLEIPASVTTIDRNAFVYNALSGVTFGPNIASVGYGAFTNNEASGACGATPPLPLTGGTITFTGSAPTFGGGRFGNAENLTVRYPRGASGWPLSPDEAETKFGPGVTQIPYGEAPNPGGGGGSAPTPAPAPSTTPTPTAVSTPTATPTPPVEPSAAPSLRPIGGGLSLVTDPAGQITRVTRAVTPGTSPSTAPSTSIRVDTPTRVSLTDLPPRTSLTAQARIGERWTRIGRVRTTSAGRAVLPPILLDRPRSVMLRVRGIQAPGYYLRVVAR